MVKYDPVDGGLLRDGGRIARSVGGSAGVDARRTRTHTSEEKGRRVGIFERVPEDK
jgi:hypothetical protein